MTRSLATWMFAMLAAAAVNAAPPPEPAPWAQVAPGLKPLSVDMPEFPTRLVSEGILGGRVHVVVEVAPDGRVSDSLVTAYTQPELARATRQAVKDWRFAPTTGPDGGGIIHTLDLTLTFEPEAGAGFVMVEARAMSGADYTAEPHGSAPVPVDQLDAPLRVVDAPQPVYPVEWEQQGVTGDVQVSFYVDGQGRVRVPTVRGAPHPWLAALAMDAVRRWRFTPPTHNGKPAIVHITQPFSFGAEARPAGM